MLCAITVMGKNSIVPVNNVMFLIFFLLFQFLKTQYIGAVIRAFQGASAAGVAFVSQSLAIGCRGITIVGTICGTAGGIPQTGAFLILTNRATRTGGVFSQVRTGFTIVIHGGCSRQAGLRSGFAAHGAAVHISVTRIGFDFVFGLAVAIQTSLPVLNIAFGDSRIVITGAAGCAFTRSIFAVTSLTDAKIWFLASNVITRAGRDAFFEISSVVGAIIVRFISFGTGSLGITFFYATFTVIQIIIITSGRHPAVILISIISRKLIPRTISGVGDKTGRGKLGEGGVVKPSPTPP